MEIIDENVDGPASSGQAADTPEQTPETPKETEAEYFKRLEREVWQPPAYLQLLGQAMESCARSGAGKVAIQAAAQAAQELRNLELQSPDSDTPLILRAHVHALNGVFARLIAQSMDRPLKYAPLIAKALQAQQQCIDTMEALRQIREFQLRCQRHGDINSRDLEKLRLLRIRNTR